MRLDCIIDNCPITKSPVDHRDCCQCKYNQLGDKQPSAGVQECNHADAHKDKETMAKNKEAWQALKSAPITLHITHCGQIRYS